MSIALRQAVARSLKAAIFASASAVGFSGVALAQEGAPATLEEVMVTATRSASETDLQTTPVSVTAVTATQIDQFVAKDISAIASSVPGFSASRITAFNAASFAMRGVGVTDIIVYQDSPVGVQVDDFVMPSVQTQLLDTFDIQSVEVLRGPQGTLFGKNTTGGAVQIRTKRPDMSEFGADVRLSYGSFNTQRVQAAVDLPVIEDVFSVRVAASYNKSDGYYKLGADYGPLVTFTADPIPGITDTSGEGFGAGQSIGGDDVVNGRIKAQWNPSDDVTVLLQYEYMRDKSDAVPSYNDTPPDGPYLWNFLGVTRPSGDPLDNMASSQRSGFLIDMQKGQRIDVDGIYANLEWDLGSHTLFAVAGKRDQDEHLPNTYTGAAPVNTVDGSVLSLFDATRDTTRETTQFEVRLASNNDGAFNYVVGAFQQTNDAAFCVVQVLGFVDMIVDFGALGLPPQLFNNNPSILCNAQDSDSLASFADLTWKVTDKFTLGAGLRYTRDERSWEGRTQVEFDLLDDNTFNGSLDWTDFSSAIQAANFKKYTGGVYVNQDTPGYDNLSRTWSEESWRLTGSYQFNDSLFSYLTMSRGYKAGGYNDQTGTSRLMVASLTRPVNPEFATNYELGFKYESPSGRFRLNPTLFMTKYEDAQRAVNILTEVEGSQFQETVFYNAAEVTSKGLEIEMQALLTDNFQVRAQASFLDAKYDTFTINQPGLTDPATGGTILPFQGDFSGLPVPRSPERSGSVQGVYTMDLANGSLAIAGEVYYEAENLFYISAAGREFDAYLDEKTLVNLSVTYTDAADRYFVRAFGKNLLDERYRIASQSVATLWTHTQWGAPVSFGLEFGAKFGSSR
ncbi:MAG: TonB-dependent receptor [Steroidobacteraceae bacterium]